MHVPVMEARFKLDAWSASFASPLGQSCSYTAERGGKKVFTSASSFLAFWKLVD